MVVQGSMLNKTELFSRSGTDTAVFCMGTETKWGFTPAVRGIFKC